MAKVNDKLRGTGYTNEKLSDLDMKCYDKHDIFETRMGNSEKRANNDGKTCKMMKT